MAKQRFGYGLLLLAAAVFHIFHTDYISFFTLMFFLLLPVFSLLFTIFSVRGVNVRLDTKKEFSQRGDPIVFSVHARKKGWTPALQARLKVGVKNAFASRGETEFLFVSMGKTEQILCHSVNSLYCGKISITLDEVRLYDFLGIFSFRQKNIGHAAVVFVLPAFHALEPSISQAVNMDMESAIFSKEKSGDDPSEIFGLRAYRSGDRSRNIHWKLSEKLDDLMVKEFSLPVFSSVVLLADFTGSIKEADTLADTLYSLSLYLLENQIFFTIRWFDNGSGQLCSAEVTDDDSLALTLNAVLTQCTRQDSSLALEAYNKLNGCYFPHAVYLTSRLSPEPLAQFCDRPSGSRTSILQITESEETSQEERDLTAALGAEFLRVRPGAMEKDLAAFTL